MKNRKHWKKASKFAILTCIIACILASCSPAQSSDTDSSPVQPAEENPSEAPHEADKAEGKPAQFSEEEAYAYEAAEDQQEETADEQDAGQEKFRKMIQTLWTWRDISTGWKILWMTRKLNPQMTSISGEVVRLTEREVCPLAGAMTPANS